MLNIPLIALLGEVLIFLIIEDNEGCQQKCTGKYEAE